MFKRLEIRVIFGVRFERWKVDKEHENWNILNISTIFHQNRSL